MNNKIPIVFAFDKNHLLPASIAIASLLKSSKICTEYDIFILSDGSITENDKEKFSKYGKLNWITVDKNRFNNVPKNDYWSELVYYRILIPELLPQYDKVIYSDVDVLFCDDLSAIFNKDISNYYWGGVIAEKNTPNTICHKYFPENKNEFIYMSGFMLINCKKMREDNIIEKIFDNIRFFDKRLKFFDLDLLNITCDKITSVPFEYCVLENIYSDFLIQNAKEYAFLSKVYSNEELTKAKDNPKIIHYAGKNPKIWLRKTKDIPKYYLKFIKESPFYKQELFYATPKSKLQRKICKILAKVGLTKDIRYKYRKQLNEYRF